MKKTEMLMKKLAYLGVSILELNKILTYNFRYDYAKTKYDGKTKLCHMDTDSFLVYIKTEDIYKKIVENVKTRFHTSNYG